MFMTALDAKRYENQPRGLEARQKEGLWALLRPVMGRRRRYLRRMDILRDVRAGLLSPTAAEKELDRLDGLSVEGLERMAQRLERSCERLEAQLNSWADDMERSMHSLEAALRGR
ncbi:MAG: hypothetical protein ACI4XW_04325 [Candidatus Spyradocola sp.]